MRSAYSFLLKVTPTSCMRPAIFKLQERRDPDRTRTGDPRPDKAVR